MEFHVYKNQDNKQEGNIQKEKNYSIGNICKSMHDAVWWWFMLSPTTEIKRQQQQQNIVSKFR